MVSERRIATGSSALFMFLALAVGCGKGGNNMTPPQDPTTYPPPTKKMGMTWYKDVLPIVQTSCQGCHNTGGIAPFPLLTYDDGQGHAPLMASATQARRMPPWMPSQDCQNFK